MTLEDVIAIVEDETGQKVTAETRLDSLGLDSLDYLSLMVRLSIPDSAVPAIETVEDCYKAQLQ